MTRDVPAVRFELLAADPRVGLVLNIGAVAFGLGLLQFLNWPVSIGGRSFLLFFALTFILTAAMTLLARVVPSIGANGKRFAVAISILVAASYYVLHGQTIYWLALAWLMLVYGVVAIYATGQRMMMEYFLIADAHKSFRNGKPYSPPGCPVIYVAAQAGMGVYTTHKLVSAVAQSLIRYHHRLGGSIVANVDEFEFEKSRRSVSRMIKTGKLIAGFIVSDSVRFYPLEFRLWLARNCAAYISVTVLNDLSPVLLNESPQENDTDSDGFFLNLGPTFHLMVGPTDKEIPVGKAAQPSIADQTIHADVKAHRHDIGDVIAPLVQRLAATSIPMFIADSRLSTEVRPVVQRIAKSGTPVVGDSYLRVRLAQSDVERFIALIDAFEAIVRFNCLVLVATRWKRGLTDFGTELAGRPMALGAWARFLRSLEKGADATCATEKHICEFWRGPVCNSQVKLVKLAIESGVHVTVARMDNQLDWLDWLNEFRNVTKGHGILEEKAVSILWIGLHEAYLQVVAGMDFLLFQCSLSSGNTIEVSAQMGGWCRHGERPTGRAMPVDSSVQHMAFLVSPMNDTIPLHPLVQLKANEVLLWDWLAREEHHVEMLNYSTGKIEIVPVTALEERDVHALWTMASQRMRS